MIAKRLLAVTVALGIAGLPGTAVAQTFAAMVSPPRFELGVAAGKTERAVIEISNRSATPSRFHIRTADWTLTPDMDVQFQDALQSGSCRPWVAIERPEVVVPAGGTLRYRFEVAVPADAPAGECRFALMIDGADPSTAGAQNLKLPITGRIGVIVYVDVGACAPQLEVFGPKVASLNGQLVPTLRVHNAGNAHGRMSGFLQGTDAKGIAYDFIPADFPIMPQEERAVFLIPSTATDEHPTINFPVTVRGTLEWGAQQKTKLEQTFE